MKFFGFFSVLLILLLSSCFDCYVFQCSFFVARKERSDVYTGQHQVGCNGEFKSYDGEGFERSETFPLQDTVAMMGLDFSKKDDVSALAEQRHQKPALEVTEYVSFTTHHSSIIPQGVGEKFPNLKHFMFNLGILSTLSKEDLKQFPQVLSFDFKSNKLEYLEDDLFANNVKLIYVELEDNNIMQVSSNIGLFKMNKLFYIHMERNRCINEVFYCKDCKDDELAKSLKEFDTKLTNECASLGIIRSFEAITNSAIITIQEAAAEQTKSINEMKAHITQMDQGLDRLNSGLTAVQSKVNDHTENLNKMSEQITQINGNMLKVQDSVEKFSKTIDRVYNLISLSI